MAKINSYYEKKNLMQKLAEELEKLEDDQALKQELEFESRVKDLMKEFDKEPRDVLQILAVIDPNLPGADTAVAAGGRAKRPLRTYKNPHTGEVVKTRGGNHKTLKEWREKWGKEEVQNWVEA